MAEMAKKAAEVKKNKQSNLKLPNHNHFHMPLAFPRVQHLVTPRSICEPIQNIYHIISSYHLSVITVIASITPMCKMTLGFMKGTFSKKNETEKQNNSKLWTP